MPAIEVPTFLQSPRAILVRCDSFQPLGPLEVACSVKRYDGQERVIIVSTDYFDFDRGAVRGFVIAEVKDGELVDFPSGDRVVIANQSILATNGRTV